MRTYSLYNYGQHVQIGILVGISEGCNAWAGRCVSNPTVPLGGNHLVPLFETILNAINLVPHFIIWFRCLKTIWLSFWQLSIWLLVFFNLFGFYYFESKCVYTTLPFWLAKVPKNYVNCTKMQTFQKHKRVMIKSMKEGCCYYGCVLDTPTTASQPLNYCNVWNISTLYEYNVWLIFLSNIHHNILMIHFHLCSNRCSLSIVSFCNLLPLWLENVMQRPLSWSTNNIRTKMIPPTQFINFRAKVAKNMKFSTCALF